VQRFTSADGLTIAYHEWGPTEGRPLILQHGFTHGAIDGWQERGVVGRLVAAGRRVVGIDARGHGDSDKPHDPGAYGEDKMARDLRTLIDVLAVPEIDLVGYSMGAVISLIAATVDDRIRRLVIGGVGAAVVELGGVDTRAVPNTALAEALRAEDPASVTRPDIAAFRERADAVGADRLALAARADAAYQQPIPLDRITAPPLLVTGADDPLAQRPQVLVDAIPDARWVVLPGDHLSVLADPRFSELILAFLDD